MENESVTYGQNAHLSVLRAAMKKHRRTQDDIAAVLNVDRSSVSRIMTGDRQIKISELQKMCEYLGLDAAQVIANMSKSEITLMTETLSVEQADKIETGVSYLSGQVKIKTKIRGAIPEIDVSLGAGEGNVGEVVPLRINDETYSQHPVTAEWLIPELYSQHELHIGKANALIMKVVGDSMSPTYSPGDRVIIDTKQTSMTVDGVYIISDGDSPPQIKRLQRVLFTSPPEVDVVSDNPSHRVQRVQMEQLLIFGRVAGRVSAA